MKHGADAPLASAAIEPLSVDECLDRLSSTSLGRTPSAAPGERTHFVRILPASITGRRITRA